MGAPTSENLPNYIKKNLNYLKIAFSSASSEKIKKLPFELRTEICEALGSFNRSQKKMEKLLTSHPDLERLFFSLSSLDSKATKNFQESTRSVLEKIKKESPAPKKLQTPQKHHPEKTLPPNKNLKDLQELASNQKENSKASKQLNQFAINFEALVQGKLKNLGPEESKEFAEGIAKMITALSQLYEKSKELKQNGNIQASQILETLANNLASACAEYFNPSCYGNPEKSAWLQASCEEHYKEALSKSNPEVAKWIAINVGLFILGFAIIYAVAAAINKEARGHFTFWLPENKIQTEKAINELDLRSQNIFMEQCLSKVGPYK